MLVMSKEDFLLNTKQKPSLLRARTTLTDKVAVCERETGGGGSKLRLRAANMGVCRSPSVARMVAI
mgnify:CR=1 FL=1